MFSVYIDRTTSRVLVFTTHINECARCQHDLVTRSDRNITAANACAAPCYQLPTDVHIAVRDDADSSRFSHYARGGCQPVHVHYIAEIGCGPNEAGTTVNRPANVDRASTQRDSVDCVDPAVNRYLTWGVAWCATAEELRYRSFIRRPGRSEKLVHEGCSGGSNCQRSYIHHTSSANHHAIRICEPDIAADVAVLHGVEHAIDVGPRVAYQVD